MFHWRWSPICTLILELCTLIDYDMVLLQANMKQLYPVTLSMHTSVLAITNFCRNTGLFIDFMTHSPSHLASSSLLWGLATRLNHLQQMYRLFCVLIIMKLLWISYLDKLCFRVLQAWSKFELDKIGGHISAVLPMGLVLGAYHTVQKWENMCSSVQDIHICL